MNGRVFTLSPHRKGMGDLEKKIFVYFLLSQLRHLPFLFFCHASVLFSSLYSLLTSALLRGNMLTGRTDAQTELKYPNKHEDLKMYRCHWWTKGIRQHPETVVDFWGTLLSHFGLLV